jgi:hypothetical protein
MDSIAVKDKPTVVGKIHIKCVHADGRIETREVDNVVTAAGKAQVAFLINTATALPFTALAIGTGTATAATTDTTLGTELTSGGFERAAATLSRVTTDDANDTARLVVAWTSSSSGATVAVTEVGAFNAMSSGVMLGRQTYAPVNMVENDELEITYDFDVD